MTWQNPVDPDPYPEEPPMRADHHTEHRPRGRKPRCLRAAPGRLAIAALAAAAFALAPPSPASAQPALWATSPEDGAALDVAPGEIAATFSEVLDGAASDVAVTGPDRAPIELERPAFNDNVLIQPMRYTVPGDYTVTVSAVFEDGQSLEIAFGFSVESIPDMLSAAVEHAGGSDPEAADTATGGSDANLGLIVGLALLAALAAGAVGARLARRSSRR